MVATSSSLPHFPRDSPSSVLCQIRFPHTVRLRAFPTRFRRARRPEELRRVFRTRGTAAAEGGDVDSGVWRSWRRENVQHRNVPEGGALHARFRSQRWVPAERSEGAVGYWEL